MTTAPSFDDLLAHVAAGGVLTADDIQALAASPDVLQLGMLADAARRRLHGGRTTFLRVAVCPIDSPAAGAVPPAAREVRLTGSPDTLSAAVAAVGSARAAAGERVVSGFSWRDVDRLASAAGASPRRVLDELRQAGLDALAEVPLDAIPDPAGALEAIAAAGCTDVRLTIEKRAAGRAFDLLGTAARLQERFGCIRALNPLPMRLDPLQPTTGYEDVRMIAVARLAAPNIRTIQVDWQRYGPKLAQVALTFGADDLDGVAASDEAPQGRRRAPLEEIRRNIEAAGFEPVERDGRFAVLA